MAKGPMFALTFHFSLEGTFPPHPPEHRQEYLREMIIESQLFRLEKALKITESNCNPNTAKYIWTFPPRTRMLQDALTD